MDTVIVHNTGVYLFDSDENITEKKVEQYKFSSAILSKILNVDEDKIITMIVCEQESLQKNSGIKVINPQKLVTDFENCIKNNVAVFDDEQVNMIFRKLVRYAQSGNTKRDIRS